MPEPIETKFSPPGLSPSSTPNARTSPAAAANAQPAKHVRGPQGCVSAILRPWEGAARGNDWNGPKRNVRTHLDVQDRRSCGVVAERR